LIVDGRDKPGHDDLEQQLSDTHSRPWVVVIRLIDTTRHAPACPGHPRLKRSRGGQKASMTGASPATANFESWL
jgi:hypothetical protein